MASNKNQHFVPRCYLRPFTLNGEGHAISLFNIDRMAFIESAPVKNQCSGDYFYGRDLTLEKALQGIEGMYANSLSKIVAQGYQLSDPDRLLLRSFWLLQYSRTDAASRRMAEMTNGMVEIAHAPEAYRMAVREAVQLAMGMFDEMLDEVADLKVCLLRNRTKLPFITSDDPAIVTNRWHLHDERARGSAIGLSKAGVLGLLPLSPDISCVVYDGDVYSIPHRDGWADVGHVEDVTALNEHQLLNCRANLFYKGWPDREIIRGEFQRVSSRRPEVRYHINIAILDKEEDGYARYKVVAQEEADQADRALIHCEAIAARPSSWPSVIQWRSRGSVYSNRTGMGFVRRRTAEAHGRSFVRIRIN